METVMSSSLRNFVPLIAAAALWSGSAFAGSVVLDLHSKSLINVTDAAGLTQPEAGWIGKGATKVGNYFLSRRVDTLTNALFNTGATHITLFFEPQQDGTSPAPDNVTLDGAHDFSSGGFKGSVSAASSPYSWIKGADASYSIASNVDTLTIHWLANQELTLP
jgi:hypothetical protein